MSNRRGFAVLEIMVGMVVLAIGLLGVGGMTVAASRRASGLAVQSSRDGIVLQELNKLASLPYDSLDVRVGCATTTSNALTYTRCIAVNDIADGIGYKRVRLIVTPEGPFTRPDTVYVNRAKATAVNPLGQ
jgi:prepilin-type N-terminal cleavage/methylation domain-containing protein